MKVLIVIPANIVNGEYRYSTFINTEIEGLKSVGHKVEEYYFTKRNSLFAFRSEVRKLNSKISDFKPDVIHSHYGATCGLLVSFARRTAPWIITFGGSELLGHPNKGLYWRFREFLSIRMSHFAARKADFIICVSENLKEELSAINKRKCMVIPRGVDTAFFFPNRGSRYSSQILFSLPRLNAHVKNLPLAEKVIGEYNQKYGSEIQLYIINNLKQTEIRNLFQNCDALLVTSFHEGSPNIVKEAMACNVPIVTVDCGDVRYLLSHVRNSYVSSSYDAKELAVLLHKIIISEDKSSNGSDMLKFKGLDISSCVDKITNIYEKLKVNGFYNHTCI